MAKELSIPNRGEAIDYLMNEKALGDATIVEHTFSGIKAWLTQSKYLDSYYLFPNGQFICTNVLRPSSAAQYESQLGEPFPYQRRRPNGEA